MIHACGGRSWTNAHIHQLLEHLSNDAPNLVCARPIVDSQIAHQDTVFHQGST